MGAASASDKETSEDTEKDKEVHSEGTLIAERYELVSQVGIGGMGVVWRARDRKLGRAVAVKVLSGTSVGNEIARTRLIREARAAAALEHDGIIRVYDVGETEDGGAFLVMELIRGRSLRYAIEDKSMKLGSVAQVIVQSARALQFAHDAGIVHRDMKPDNIMIREDGRVTVVDFGVAKPIATDLMVIAGTVAGTPAGGALTGSGQLVGTPAYLAPEQARGLPVGPATDQFALAVTAYEAFTGARPWAGSCFSEVIASLLRDSPVPVSATLDVPKALDDVLATALAKDPSMRYADIGAFADALEDATRTLEVDPVAMKYSRRSGAVTHPDPPQLTVPAALTPPTTPIAPAPPASAEPSPVEGIPITTTGNGSVEMPRKSVSSDPGVVAERRSKPTSEPAIAKPASKTWLYVVGGVAALGIAIGAWSAGPRTTPSPNVTTTQAPAVNVPPPSATPLPPNVAAPIEPTAPVVEPSQHVAPATTSAAPKKPPTAVVATVAPPPKPSASAKPAASAAQPAVKPSATSTGRRVREDL